MRKIIIPAIIAFGLCLAAPLASADGSPDLKISTWEGSWKDSEVVRTRGTTREMYLRLENMSDGDGNTTTGTFTLDGITGGTDWDITYRHDGTTVSVPYDVEIEEGDTETVKVAATPQAYPNAYLWASESAGNAFTLSGNGKTDEASAVLVIPGDLEITQVKEGTWVGGDTILDPASDKWGSEQQVPDGSSATEGAAMYRVKLHNVENATVLYRLKTHTPPGSDALLQVAWRTNSSWEAVEDITTELTSSAGHETSKYLQPGETYYFKLYVLPVGSADTVRRVAITASVSDVDGLGGLGDLTDLVPLTAYMEDLPSEGGTFDLYGDPEDDNLSPGNFGLMDFDGGSNPTGELEDWLVNRYDLSVPDDQDHLWVYGSPGYKSATSDEIQSLVGQTLNVPVATEIKDPGANSQFKMEGFAQVVLKNFDDGDPATATVEWMSFFQMPILTEAVICNTGRAEGLAMGPWEEIE